MNQNTIYVDITVNNKGSAVVKQFGTDVEQAGKKGSAGINSISTASRSLTNDMGRMITSVATYSLAFGAMSAVVGGVVGEFKRGLSAVEDFGMTVAKSTALITTFSQKGKEGDIAGALFEANNYAVKLAETMEVIDAKTIANAKDLNAMNEAFLSQGVRLNVYNQEQVDGYTATANALAILTQGMDKEQQMRQEIRGLMDGQIKAGDSLGLLLKAQIPDIENQLKIWRSQGTVLEHLGELLKGFNATTGLLENQWATVGSTMETIHNRVLRGAFKPIFEDLLGLVKELNRSLMDTEGNLTPLAHKIQAEIMSAYADGKVLLKEYGRELGLAAGYLGTALAAQLAFNLAIKTNPYVLAAVAIGHMINKVDEYKAKTVQATTVTDAFTQSLRGAAAVLRGEISLIDYAMSSEAELTKLLSDNAGQGSINASLDQMKTKLQEVREGWAFTSEARVAKEESIAAIKDQISLLETQKEAIKGISAADSDWQRERNKGGGAFSPPAPEMATPSSADTNNKHGSDLNAVLNSRLALLKSHEEKEAAIVKMGAELTSLAEKNKYENGLSTYQEYLTKKNALTEQSLQAELIAKQKELKAAQGAVDQLKPITDKKGKSNPEKDEKARVDALKRIEEADKDVLEAENKLAMARAAGAQEVAIASREQLDGYKAIGISLLELQGHTVEAAKMQAAADEGSIERKRLILEADSGLIEAQKALAAVRLKSAIDIKAAELDDITRKATALEAIAEMDGEFQKSREIQMQLLDIEIQRAELYGKKPEEIALLRRQREELEKMLDPLSAFSAGWNDTVRNFSDGAENMRNAGRTLAADLKSAFSDTFASALKGEFSSIGEAFNSLCDAMVNAFINAVAQMAAQQLTTAIFGGTTSTSGGLVNTAAGMDWSWLGGSDSSSTVTDNYSDFGGSDWDDLLSENYADGGVLQGGSGTKDDLFMGKVGGKNIFAKGGEYFMPPEQTAKYYPILEGMRTGRDMYFAGGGTTSRRVAPPSSTSSYQDVISFIQQLAKAKQEATATAESIRIFNEELSNNSKETAEAAGQTSETARQTTALSEAISQESEAKEKSTETSTMAGRAIDAVDSKLGAMAISAAAVATGVPGAVVGLGLLGAHMAGLDVSISGLVDGLATLGEAAISAMAEIGEALGFAQSSAAAIDAAYNEAGFKGYTPGDLYGESTDPGGYYGESDAGYSGDNSGYGGGEGGYGDATGQGTDGSGGMSSDSDSNYADGGIHRGGWRVVGERGPELEFTPPSQIFSNSDSKKILQGNQQSQNITIPLTVQIGNKTVEQYIIRIADGQAAIRQQKGITGRMYAQ